MSSYTSSSKEQHRQTIVDIAKNISGQVVFLESEHCECIKTLIGSGIAKERLLAINKCKQKCVTILKKTGIYARTMDITNLNLFDEIHNVAVFWFDMECQKIDKGVLEKAYNCLVPGGQIAVTLTFSHLRGGFFEQYKYIADLFKSVGIQREATEEYRGKSGIFNMTFTRGSKPDTQQLLEVLSDVADETQPLEVDPDVVSETQETNVDYDIHRKEVWDNPATLVNNYITMSTTDEVVYIMNTIGYYKSIKDCTYQLAKENGTIVENQLTHQSYLSGNGSYFRMATEDEINAFETNRVPVKTIGDRRKRTFISTDDKAAKKSKTSTPSLKPNCKVCDTKVTGWAGDGQKYQLCKTCYTHLSENLSVDDWAAKCRTITLKKNDGKEYLNKKYLVKFRMGGTITEFEGVVQDVKFCNGKGLHARLYFPADKQRIWYNIDELDTFTLCN